MTTTEAAAESSRSAQQTRRMSVDWFRVPPTDYLNVSTISYPRGSKATVEELNLNNAAVDVMFYKQQSRSFLRDGKQAEDWIIQLFVDTDDFQDATLSSTKFAAIGVQSKSLLDALKPSLTSVHCPIPEHVTDQHRFYPPFNELFFAQGRILETLKHAGLGSAKEKQLRTFVTVMQVVLRKLNHTVRDMAGKKITDFEHLWTLFPPGSFAVSDIKGLTHLSQVIENSCEVILPDPNARKRDEKHLSVKFASYGFDGFSFGCYEDNFNFFQFKGFSSIASLDYRPLKFEERFGDVSVVEKAIERGRKSLRYQSYHHCQYNGKCYSLDSNENSGTTAIDGRVVVDCLQARKTATSYLSFFYHTEHTIMPIPSKRQEIYNAMRPLFLSSQARRPNVEEQEKRRQFFEAHDEYLMLLKPLLPAYSLDLNTWIWVNVEKLEEVEFPPNPLDRLEGSSNKRMGLLNLLIDSKLKSMADADSEEKKTAQQLQSLIVLMFGPTGTGKTATVKAIAELHQRPLMNISVPRAGSDLQTTRKTFSQILLNASSWKALVLFDNASFVLGKNKSEPFYDQPHVAADHAVFLEHFSGVLFLTKRDTERLIHPITKQVKVHLKFEPFTIKQRRKIWKSLLRSAGDHEQQKWQIPDSGLDELSTWELNGHDIEHMYRNIQLLYPLEQELFIEELKVLKDLTLCPESEWSRPSSRSSSPERHSQSASDPQPPSSQ